MRPKYARKYSSEKGQLFSLDLVIAMGLSVLAIGMLLNYYESTTYQQKEAVTRNELSAIALNASNLALDMARCTSDFDSQGYDRRGCGDVAKLSPANKARLMIPEGFGCYVYWDRSTNKEPIDASGSACKDPAPNTVKDIATVQRIFAGPNTPGNQLTKAVYLKCIETGCGGNNNPYDTYTLTVEVWRG
ncbi:MAG: hypothetical protein HY544_03330 [Candidatus Diapherotrites archaeon]|uniref:Uncharacterized protein n=1 Tax=Candidatus Iainarchaeum sp. TaxID=3101447 RepID=A0A8T3YLE5_9ARCH|nr:hypothetical protein [Candidatus Diapherotrites archaeon]